MILERLASSDRWATRGRILADDGVTVLVPATLEPSPPDLPAGTYPARLYASPHFGYPVYRLYDVPGHDAIELHKGNLPKDTHGCVLLGGVFGLVYDESGQNPEPGILQSAYTFRTFMEGMQGAPEFSLTVRPIPEAPDAV